MSHQSRELWIDAVKGLTIILVVFHHVFQGVQTSIGFSDLTLEIYRLTSPIRMPLFFLVAGFFAKKAIDGTFNKFLETKVLHFAYFYVLWSIISITTRSALGAYTNNDVQYSDIFKIFWEPTFTLWFLYALLIAFTVARLTRNIPFKIQIVVSFLVAIAVHSLPDQNLILVRTAKLYPLFIIGVYYSSSVRNWVSESSDKSLFALFGGYILIATLLFITKQPVNWFYYYLLAAFGITSMMKAMYMLRAIKPVFSALRYVGERSMYVYLMHFLPAAGSRVILTKSGFSDPILITLVCTLISVLSCLIVYRLVSKLIPRNFLFIKPEFINAK